MPKYVVSFTDVGEPMTDASPALLVAAEDRRSACIAAIRSVIVGLMPDFDMVVAEVVREDQLTDEQLSTTVYAYRPEAEEDWYEDTFGDVDAQLVTKEDVDAAPTD